MSEVKIDLAYAAALLQQSETLKRTAKKSFTDLLARLKKKKQVLSQLVVEGQSHYKGIYIKFPESGYANLRLNDDADLYDLSIRVDLDELMEKHGAVRCIETLISAIRERLDAIITPYERAQSAIEMAEATLPD